MTKSTATATAPSPLSTPARAPLDLPQRNAQVAQDLRQAARMVGAGGASRRAYYRSLGLLARPRDRVFQALFVLAFAVGGVLPFALGATYVLALASPQYQSEARFVLRTSLPALPGGDHSASRKASLKIVQDTAIVQSFLTSPAFVDQLDRAVGLHTVFGGDHIDPLSRLAPDASLAQKTDYVDRKIRTHVSATSGIVTVRLRSFDPQTAQATLTTALALAEARVNRLNGDIWRSVLQAAQDEFDAASAALRGLRGAHHALQNETGVFNIALQAQAQSALITQLRAALVQMETRRTLLAATMAKTHPNRVQLDRRIAVQKDQIAALEQDLARPEDTPGAGISLADRHQSFEALRTQTDIAQARFKAAARALEQAKVLQSLQMLRLDAFLAPTAPADPVFPKPWWALAKLALACLTLWGAVALALRITQRWLD